MRSKERTTGLVLAESARESNLGQRVSCAVRGERTSSARRRVVGRTGGLAMTLRGWLKRNGASSVAGALALLGVAATAGCGGGFNPFNGAPNAVMTANPTTGLRAGQEVAVDAGGSTDPDGDPLTFEWKQMSGPAGTFYEPNAAATTFAAPSALDPTEVRIAVVVRDGKGGEATAQQTLQVSPSSEFAGPPQSLTAYRDTLTRKEAYHLLRRAALGATPQQVDAAVQAGLAATVNDLIQVKPTPTEVDALADGYEEDVTRRWLVHFMEGPNPLLERLTLFWHDRFATSRRVLTDRDRNLGVVHWQMLRANALGNYRAFLEQLTLDPLMLIWLDGANSPKSKPNENYAREFWELFTLGRDVLYTEDDIKEAARAFTGVILFREQNLDARPLFDLTKHDNTGTTLFPGRTPGPFNYDYKTIIDVTLAQPEAPRYVARNLFVLFVHDHPTDATVQALADAFVAGNYEIAPLVKTLLMSQALFSPAADGNQVSSPVEHVLGVARTLDMHMTSEDSQGFILDQLVTDLTGSGQELLNPPGVQGWGEDQAWLEDQWVISRVRALTRTMEYGPNRVTQLPYHLLPADTTWNTAGIQAQIVDALANVFQLTLTDEERNLYISVLDQNGRTKFNVASTNTRRSLVRDLLRLMAMDDRVMTR